MPDNTLQFETKVDLSGLNAGVAAVTKTVTNVGDNLATAMNAAKVATNNLKDAQLQLGAAAAAGSKAAAAAIAEYQAEADKATASVNALKNAQLAEAEAARIAAIQQKRQYQEWVEANRVIVNRGEAYGTARIAAGALTGSVGQMESGLARAAASSALLGGALQAAFPIAAAVAAIEVLGEVAGKIHGIYDELVNARIAEKAFTSALLSDGELEITASHHMMEAVRQRQVVEAGLTGPKAGRANRQQAAGAAFDIAQDLNALNEAAQNIQSVHDRQEKLNNVIKGSYSIWTHSAYQIMLHHNAVKQAQYDYDALTSHATAFAADYHAAQIKLDADREQEQLRRKEAGEKESTGVDKTQAKRLKAMEAEFNAEKLAGNDSLAWEYRFWNARLNLFEVGSDQYDAILQKLATSAEAGAKKVHSALAQFKAGDAIGALDSLTGQKKSKPDEGAINALKGQAAAMNMVADAAQNAAEAAAKLNMENEHEKAAGGIQLQEAKVQAGSTLGITDPGKDLKLLRTLHQQALAEDERYIEQEMTLARVNAAKETAIHSSEGTKVREIQQRLNEELFALQRKLTLDKQKGQRQQFDDTIKILREEEQQYKKVYQTITQDFNAAIGKMITTTQGPERAFAEMLNGMLGQLANFVVQYLEQKAEMWLLDKALTLSGTVAQHTMQTASNITTVTGDAGVAAANTFAYYTAIDPPIAPAMAALAAAQTMSYVSLAAFEHGGVVQGGYGMPVPIVAHAGERVLSAPQTHRFEQLVNQSGGNQSTVHMHYEPTVQAYDRQGMRATLQSHAEDMREIMRGFLRSEAFA